MFHLLKSCMLYVEKKDRENRKENLFMTEVRRRRLTVLCFFVLFMCVAIKSYALNSIIKLNK